MYTGAKRRSSAGSFSMCLRYSSSVVAPMTCSSPRASAGFIIVEASIAPSAPPAPITWWISSMKMITSPSGALDLVHHRLQALLELAAELRARDHRAHVEREHPLVLQVLRHVAGDDLLREPFGDRRLADARLADDHRVVLRAAVQDLHHPLDLVLAADHRVELVLARRLRQVDASTCSSALYLLSAVGLSTRAPPRTSWSAR